MHDYRFVCADSQSEEGPAAFEEPHAKCLHGLPQPIAIHYVDGFRHLYECGVEVGPNFRTLLLQLAGGEDHVGGSAVSSESTLTFRQNSLFEMAIEMVEEDSSEDRSSGFEHLSVRKNGRSSCPTKPEDLVSDATSSGRA
ncbi:hypothetical protein SprV_0602158200 [Sparganum proliferum]